MMKALSWKEVLLVLGLLAALIAAHRFADGSTAAVVSIVTTLIAGMMRSWAGADPKDPPVGPALVLLFGISAVSVTACASLTPADRAEVVKTATTLANCNVAGLEAFDACAREGGADDVCETLAVGVYTACKTDGGL